MKNYDDPMEMREDFSALLDGELSAEEREALEVRLGESAETLRELENFKQVDELYKQSALPSAPEGFEKRLQEALNPSVTKSGSWWVRTRRWQPVVALAAMALITVSIFVVYQQSEPDTMRMADVASPATEAEEAFGDSQFRQRQDLTQTARDAENYEEPAAVASAPAESLGLVPESLEEAASPPVATDALSFESVDDVAAPALREMERLESDADRASEGLRETRSIAAEKKEDIEMLKDKVEQEASSAGSLGRTAVAKSAVAQPVLPEFAVVDDTLIERGYAQQETTEMPRGSETLATLALVHPELLDYAKDNRERIFKIGEVWYRLPALEFAEI